MGKIIIADDASFIRDMLSDIIVDAGHTVIGVNSGKELMEAYEKEQPDMVFMDIVMEDDGLETLDRLKEKHKDAKVVICSAVGGMDYVIKDALERGACACIKKPFGVESVLGAIEECYKK